MLHHDYELDRLAYEKSEIGCREALKRKANKVWTSGSIREVMSVYRFAQESGHLDWRKDLTMVKVGTTIMFFNQDLNSVRAMIEGLKPVRKQKLPGLILQKMIAKRIKEIHNVVLSMNTRMVQMVQLRRQYESCSSSPVVIPDPVLISIPRFETLKSLKDWFDSYRHDSCWGGSALKVERQFIRYVFSKPEVTDDDVKAANDMVLVNEVMDV